VAAVTAASGVIGGAGLAICSKHYVYNVCATAVYKSVGPGKTVFLRASLRPGSWMKPPHAADETECFARSWCVFSCTKVEMAIESTSNAPRKLLTFQPWSNAAQEISATVDGRLRIMVRCDPKEDAFGGPIQGSARWCGRVFLSYRVAADKALAASFFCPSKPLRLMCG
jgi:hypothetical protein